VRGHVFKLLHRLFDAFPEGREVLARANSMAQIHNVVDDLAR
jgi:hypothetical protein